jgi:glycerate dehydrogenase
MNIVILDGYTLNPGDLSWEQFEKLGEFRIHERTSPDDVVKRAKDAQVVFTNKTPLSSQTIGGLTKLKYIGVLATGYDIVDVEAAREQNIVVTNVPTYGTDSVAQMAFAHILNLANRVAHHSKSVHDGKWSASKDWSYWEYPLIELSDLTLGIIGFGRIGQMVAGLALAFGMQVIFYDPHIGSGSMENATPVRLKELFEISDVISLHCPLNEETEKVVNRVRLSTMKKTSFLINTSRGPLIDEEALADALNNGQIAGAGLDVLSIEPPLENNPLLKANNCFITPHNSWATKASRIRLMNAAIDNLKAFLRNEPKNVVNPWDHNFG